MENNKREKLDFESSEQNSVNNAVGNDDSVKKEESNVNPLEKTIEKPIVEKTAEKKAVTKQIVTEKEEAKKVLTPSPDENKKDQMDEIDKILNEVRRDLKEVSTEKPSEPEEEFVDILSSVVNQDNIQTNKAVSDKKSVKPATTQTKPENSGSASKKSNAKSNDEKIKLKEANPTTRKGKMGTYTMAGILGVIVLLMVSFVGIWHFDAAVIPVSASTEIPGGTIPPVSEDPVFVKGIQVAGVDIGGKTLEEAQALLYLKGSELISPVKITVQSYDETKLEYEADDFEYTYDITATLNKAYEFSQKLLKDGNTDIVANADKNDSFIIVDEEKSTVNYKLNSKVTENSVQKVVKRIAKEIDIACVQPHASKFDPSKKGDKMFAFKEGTDGLAVDQDKLRLDILEVFESGETNSTVTATTAESKPTLKMEDVKKATKLISKFSTVSTNTWSAEENMKLALKKINGTIINPGETFSFNKLTGDSNKPSEGWLAATVIENGEYTSGYGGGICQAATTIYNAGIRANMEIVERQPHLFASLYVYGGLDATINYIENAEWDNEWSIDLKMKNNTDYQMFIKTYMDGSTLYCEIYGWDDPSYDEIKTESWCTWQGSDSYGFEAERVFYKNKKEVKRESLPDSSYEYSGYGVRAADPGT